MIYKLNIINTILIVLILAVGASICFMVAKKSIDKENVSFAHWPHDIDPCVRSNGHPWRIGYYEGGSWVEYPKHLCGLINGFAKLNWINDSYSPDEIKQYNSGELWNWLSSRADSPYIEFVRDAHYSAEWSETKRTQVRQIIMERLKHNDLDLIIAMGTWAGIDLANDEHTVPTIICASSDPIRIGIIKSLEDSGRDHVHAMYNPERYLRELSAFHNIIDFDTLGIVYEDSDVGRIYANIREIHAVAKQRGFEVIERHVPDTDTPRDKCAEMVKTVFEELAPSIDALWLPAHRGQTHHSMPDILQPLMDNNVATWAQEGTEAVRRGVLLSVSEADLNDAGLFYAHVIASVFNGVKPRDIRQYFREPLAFAINLETAKHIGFSVPKPLLKSADVVYTKIIGENP